MSAAEQYWNLPLARFLQDPARLAAVRRTALLDTPPEEPFDRLTRIAAKLLGVPVTFLSLVDEDRDFYKSCFGFGEPLASMRELEGLTFCHYSIQSGQPLAIPDTRADPVYRHVPTVESLGVRAYLGVPLVTTGGQAIGSFCAVDFQPREWSELDVEVLRELAASAMREIELRVLVREMESERREMAALLESTGEGIYGLDAEGCCTFINRAAAEALGYAPEECLGRNMHQLMHHHRADGTPYPVEECPIYRAVRRGEPVRLLEEVLWRRDGSTLLAEYSAFPLAGADGAPPGAVVTFRDITERKHALTRLEETLRSRSRFYAAMSHELRTPINAILGYNDLLLAGVYGPMPQAQQTGVERSQRAAHHLLELVNDVLDLSKLEAGKLELELEEVSLPVLIDDLFTTIRPLAEEHGYALVLESEPCGDRVVTDPRRVRQILLNLLSNAIKFGETLPIRVRCARAPGGGLVVEVSDQGRGIAPEDQGRIFEEFVQVGDAQAKVTGQSGTGLGLPISRRLAELLDGSLTVESAAGKGSTFRLALPREPRRR